MLFLWGCKAVMLELLRWAVLKCCYNGGGGDVPMCCTVVVRLYLYPAFVGFVLL
jgi:hypothetical protein